MKCSLKFLPIATAWSLYFQHKDADAAGAKFSFTGKRMDLGAYAGRMSL